MACSPASLASSSSNSRRLGSPATRSRTRKRAGPSAETKEKAKKRVEYGKTGWETGKKIYETFTDVIEKQKAATEAEAKALESAGLGRQRITDWSKATGAAQKEQRIVTGWVKQAGNNKRLQGHIEEAVQKRLGPIPIIDEKQVDILTKKYELQLYRMKYRETAEYVQTVYVTLWADSAPTIPRIAGQRRALQGNATSYRLVCGRQ